MLRNILLFIVVGMLSLTFSSHADEQFVDPEVAQTLAQLENYCNEIPNNISIFAENLEDGSVKSVNIEVEPGVIKHDIFIKVSFDGTENYISCNQNFNTPLADKSLSELQALGGEAGIGSIACVAQSDESIPGAGVETMIAALQDVAEEAMCEEESKSSLGSCTRNMAYCGLENLKVTRLIKVDKPEGANCSGLLGGAAGSATDVGQCMATFIRGAFNEITDTLKFLVIEAPTWLYKKTFGRWFAEPAVEQMENVESLEAIASSDDTDEEITEEQNEPEKSFFDKVVAFTENLILEQGVKNFGCESWSSGVPGVGTCLSPPASWECASCKQKAMALCGVAGYAAGMVVETAVLAAPVGVIAGTVAGLSKASRAAKAAKLGKEATRASRVAASVTSGSLKVAKAGMAVIAPIARVGLAVGKKTVEFLKLIPGVEATAKVLSAPIRGFLKADDFLTSRSWSLTYHGSKAYTQALAKTGDVTLAISAAKTASKVSQSQNIGANLLRTQSELRVEAKSAIDPNLSAQQRLRASQRQDVLLSRMRKQEAEYTSLRSSLSPKDLENANTASSQHVSDLVNKYKAQDEQIVSDMYKYGINHVQKVENLMPEGGLILSMNESNRLTVEIPNTNYQDYLRTLQRVADDAKIDDVEALRQLAYMPSDQLGSFKATYPKFEDPMLSLTRIYDEKYAQHLTAVTDPVDKDNLVKLIRELELRQKNSTEISSKLDEILGTCSIR